MRFKTAVILVAVLAPVVIILLWNKVVLDEEVAPISDRGAKAVKLLETNKWAILPGLWPNRERLYCSDLDLEIVSDGCVRSRWGVEIPMEPQDKVYIRKAYEVKRQQILDSYLK